MPPRPLVVLWSRGETMIYSLGTKRFLMVSPRDHETMRTQDGGGEVGNFDLIKAVISLQREFTMRPRDHQVVIRGLVVAAGSISLIGHICQYFFIIWTYLLELYFKLLNLYPKRIRFDPCF